MYMYANVFNSAYRTKTRLVKDKIILNTEGQTDLEKYTFSNAMAMSVKLGIWESSLDKYIEKIEYVSEVSIPGNIYSVVCDLMCNNCSCLLKQSHF